MQGTTEKQHTKYEDSKFQETQEQEIRNIVEDINIINRKLTLIDTAFLRDDLAAPDYPGHRSYHLDRRESDKIMKDYKLSGTKVIIGIAITFIIGLLSSGLISKLSSLLG